MSVQNEVHIVSAQMKTDAEGAYLGTVVFKLEGYQHPYELTVFSKKGKEWDYSLHYTSDSGGEEELLKLDERLEEDDDLFDTLLEAALQASETI
ncbi:hypothetical protein [Paenibacillus agilis]|uniref:DUF1292 domain-containing protein n=1 Tax=Paenibacillus agilis TaxID=3020863 RepID=A0A559IZ35_9BACL|nr:hypothetical protein [Paenibacillus agilis]TVX92880.1 hypothetical protein FPZ44_07320 [Paenibacillus agilis]